MGDDGSLLMMLLMFANNFVFFQVQYRLNVFNEKKMNKNKFEFAFRKIRNDPNKPTNFNNNNNNKIYPSNKKSFNSVVFNFNKQMHIRSILERKEKVVGPSLGSVRPEQNRIEMEKKAGFKQAI